MKRILHLGLISILVSTCTTLSSSQKPNLNQTKPVAKVVEKQTSHQSEEEPSKKLLLDYVLKLNDPINPFTYQDREFLDKLKPNPPRASLQEAAITIGVIRDILEATKDLNRYKEQELTQTDFPATTSVDATVPSLEGRLQEKNVTLTESLTKNIALKNHMTYSLTAEALNRSNNSEIFTRNIRDIIYNEASHWAKLINLPAIGALTEKKSGHDIDAAETDITADTPLDISPENPAGPTREDINSIANLKAADTILMEAQRIAEKGDFKSAIGFAARISTNDPAHPAAKEKIKLFSNSAVQLLRQKAAQAFQSALPLNNSHAKIVYLEQASNFLKEALEDFPDADNLETVRNNLTVITRDFERIKQETGGSYTNQGSAIDNAAEQ